jgi:hypothetical protein
MLGRPFSLWTREGPRQPTLERTDFAVDEILSPLGRADERTVRGRAC